MAARLAIIAVVCKRRVVHVAVQEFLDDRENRNARNDVEHDGDSGSLRWQQP